jgi:hypothetical protein
VALALLAAVVVAGFLIVRSGDDAESRALEFTEAWAAQDFASMHSMLAPDAQSEFSVGEFAATYEQAQELATVTGIGVEGSGDAEGSSVRVEVVLRTALFGTLGGSLVLPTSDEGIRWAPHLVFPGLENGETLTRESRAPDRGSILTADGGLIAGGPVAARVGEIDGASQIAGSVAVPSGELAEAARERGFPADAPVGTSGLELALDEILAGTPGGTLYALGPADSTRILAEADPKPGRDVKTTIESAAQAAATVALGSQFGGIAVLDSKGAIVGLSGVAFSAPQPPGSTFKLITAAAALESGESSPGEEFPVVTGEVVGGGEIENAHDELCGGTLGESFAHSCNSVFAPLGVRVGGERLVETAEAFGFNQEPDLLSGDRVAGGTAEPSTIPTSFASELEVGVSAIGQGQVLATPLGMASVAQTIAARGRRTPPFIYSRSKPPVKVRAISAKTARQLTAMMQAVVAEGTGVIAQIP